MEDETTTSAPAENTGVETPTQPEAPQAPEAEPTASADPEQQTEQTPSEPSDDDQLAKWAEAKGLTLDSDNATKAAKMAREAERAMHQKAQRASELEKNLNSQSDDYAEQVAEQTGQDPALLKRLQRVEVRTAIQDFYDRNPDARELDSTMGEIALAKPHLAGDLDTLYALAERQNAAAAKSEAGKAALKKLAHTQTAAVPTGNATNTGTTPKQKPFAELSIAEMEAKLGTIRR